MSAHTFDMPRCLVVLAILLSFGCGDDSSPALDAGRSDAAMDAEVPIDASGTDADPVADAGASDTGRDDTGPVDGGDGDDTYPVGGWTVVANFDEGAPGEKANGDDGLSEAFRDSFYTSEQSYAGGQAAVVGVEEGATAFGQWGGSLNFPDLGEGDEIWFRCFVYFPESFDFTTDSGFLKFMRIHTASDSGDNEGYHDVLVGRGGRAVVVGSEVEGAHYANNPEWRNNGPGVSKGEWHALEMHLRYTSEPTEAVYRVWQDGELIFEDQRTRTLRSPTSVADFTYIFSYWNGGSPQDQIAYIDEIVITSGTPRARDAAGNPFIGLDIVAPR